MLAVDLMNQTTRSRIMKIIDKKAFSEAQFMASMAVNKSSSRIQPESYWEAAMACLKEAYAK